MQLIFWAVVIFLAVRGWQAWKARHNALLEEKRKQYQAGMSATEVANEMAAELDKEDPNWRQKAQAQRVQEEKDSPGLIR
jgi:predicted negative regulator of RcsB-dependent stress response